MNQEGPTLEHLLRRITETPTEFLPTPEADHTQHCVSVIAVTNDLLEMHGASPKDSIIFSPSRPPPLAKNPNVCLMLCWLLADEQLIARQLNIEKIQILLRQGADELSLQNSAEKYRDDPDRREELVRYALARLDLRPSGETIAQAQDRLTAISSVERTRVLAASREAEERARAIREALARKAAEESADKYTRE